MKVIDLLNKVASDELENGFKFIYEMEWMDIFEKWKSWLRNKFCYNR